MDCSLGLVHKMRGVPLACLLLGIKCMSKTQGPFNLGVSWQTGVSVSSLFPLMGVISELKNCNIFEFYMWLEALLITGTSRRAPS